MSIYFKEFLIYLSYLFSAVVYLIDLFVNPIRKTDNVILFRRFYRKTPLTYDLKNDIIIVT